MRRNLLTRENKLLKLLKKAWTLRVTSARPNRSGVGATGKGKVSNFPTLGIPLEYLKYMQTHTRDD
jgi:hypothetical protein